MSEESEEYEMEKKSWNKSRGGFPSQGQRSGGGKETVPKGRGQWRKERNKGRDQSSRRPPDQDCQRQFKNLSERRDGSSGTPPQRRGGVPDKRPSPRSYFPQNKGAPKNLELDLVTGTAAAGGNRGKKCGTSLNYLLNFKYAPREQTVAHRAKFSRKRQPTFNKEQFLQANCQFVVHDSGDYTVYAVDPDILVDWSLVEQVRIYSHGVPSCPICLYPPTAAKITRCGHIYCWTCMLHYQSLSDKSWQKCPICYEAIHKKDLKSVVAMANHQFMAGEQITMRLMKRSKGSVLALPKTQWQERETKPFRINDPIDTHYSKLLLASSEEVLEQVISIEEKALNEQMQQAKIEQSEEQCFLDLALQELQDRKKQLLGTKQAEVEVEEAMKNTVELQEAREDGDTNKEEGSWRMYSSGVVEAVGEYEAAFSDTEEDEANKSATWVEETDSLSLSHGDMLDIDGGSRPAEYSYASHEDRDLSLGITEGDKADDSLQEGCTSRESHTSGSEAGEEYHATDVAVVSPGSSTPNSGYYYFYQADDGQNIFLHPVNARCLVKEYGGLEYCPQLISARVLEMEALSQTEELRRRYRYLGHLPLTCEFVICELDLKPPVISRGTLECFRDVLHQRRQQRQRKMRSEKRREKKLEASNASANGFPTHTGSTRRRAESLDLDSELEFPTQGSQMAMSPPYSSTSGPSPFLQFAAVNIGHDEDYGTVTEVDNTSASPPTQGTSGGWPPSFAQALRTGKAAESAKVFKKPVKDTVGVASAKLAAPSGDVEGEGNEDHVPVPTFQSAFSEALATSWGEMQAATCNQQQRSDQSRSEVSGKKQKKGKKKQLLFTTGNFMKYT